MSDFSLGPSPLLTAAYGALKGRRLGQDDAQAQADRQRKLDLENEQVGVEREKNALELAAARIKGRQLTQADADETVRRSNQQAAAERLRADPLNRGRFGAAGSPLDPEFDYSKAERDEASVRSLSKSLQDVGYKPDEAELMARKNIDVRALREAREDRRMRRAQIASEIQDKQDQRDRERIAGWALATMQAGEKRGDYLGAVARSMNPKVRPDLVAGAIADAADAYTKGRATASRVKGGAITLADGTVVPLGGASAGGAAGASAGPEPSNDEIDAAIDALEKAGKQPTTDAVMAEVRRARGGR